MDDVEALLDEYSPIVNRIARSACFSSPTIDFGDLCQVGDLAVIRAVEAYDPSCGTNIRSFVSRCVRQDIYSEAARFLGVFTVDHRVTSLAAKVNRLHHQGKSDQEIVDELADTTTRSIDLDHIRDLRIAYSRRQHTVVSEEDCTDYSEDEFTMNDLLDSVVKSDRDRIILSQRIMGDASIEDAAEMMGVSKKQAYALERTLKKKIRVAIEDVA